MIYKLVFANRSDRTIRVPKYLAHILSYVFKSPKYIMVMKKNWRIPSSHWVKMIDGRIGVPWWEQ